MDFKYEKMLNIEKKLAFLFQKHLMVELSSRSEIKKEGYRSLLFEQIGKERKRLDSIPLSYQEILNYCTLLEAQIEEEGLPLTFDDLCFADFSFEPKVRLFSYYNRKKLLHLCFKSFFNSKEKSYLLEEIFQKRVLEKALEYHDSCHLFSDQSYLRFFYLFCFSCLGIGDPWEYSINLDSILPHKEFRKVYDFYEKTALKDILLQDIVPFFHEISPDELQSYFSSRFASFNTAVYLYFANSIFSNVELKQLLSLVEEKEEIVFSFLKKTTLTLRVVK